MRVLIRREVPLAVPAEVAWRYVTDWPAQGEWVPHTRVELADPGEPAAGVGGRVRAWTGVGPVGFWDAMTITAWDEHADGGGRCEVLHTGSVVRGEGVFEVVSDGAGQSRFLWTEMAVVPGGRVGALGWRAARPAVERMVDRGLSALKDRLETADPQRGPSATP